MLNARMQFSGICKHAVRRPCNFAQKDIPMARERIQDNLLSLCWKPVL
jgi:hypothetical protein